MKKIQKSEGTTPSFYEYISLVGDKILDLTENENI